MDDDDGKGHYTVIYNIYIYMNITNPMNVDNGKVIDIPDIST